MSHKVGDQMTTWNEHLEKTSRTFALAIPLLEEPLRREVTISYLLFRVVDTLEDAAVWTASQRSSCLRTCAQVIRHGTVADAKHAAGHWLDLGPTRHAGYLELIRSFPSLLADTRALHPSSLERIEHHLLRTIERMDSFVRTAHKDGTLVLETKEALRSYCYAVAGIVGELLTDLFVLHAPRLHDAADALRRHAPRFGEGLQLVNIARDASGDAKEGRRFIPPGMLLEEVLAWAEDDLDHAMAFVDLLRSHGAPSGTTAFAALPAMLARSTIERVRTEGFGAKLSRAEVGEILLRVQRLASSPARVALAPQAS